MSDRRTTPSDNIGVNPTAWQVTQEAQRLTKELAELRRQNAELRKCLKNIVNFRYSGLSYLQRIENIIELADKALAAQPEVKP